MPTRKPVKKTSVHVCEDCGESVTYFNSNRPEHSKRPGNDRSCPDPPRVVRRSQYVPKKEEANPDGV